MYHVPVVYICSMYLLFICSLQDAHLRHPTSGDQRTRIFSGEISSALRYPSYLERGPDYEAEMQYYRGETLSPHGRVGQEFRVQGRLYVLSLTSSQSIEIHITLNVVIS